MPLSSIPSSLLLLLDPLRWRIFFEEVDESCLIFLFQPSYRAAARGVKVDDAVLYIYTSGTTGLPKGLQNADMIVLFFVLNCF